MQKLLNKKTYLIGAAGALVVTGFLLANKHVPVPDTSLPTFVSQEDGTSASKAPTTRFTDPSGAFSFAYPTGASVHTAPGDGGGEVITVEQAGSASGAGIQIVVASFDEDIALTPERIKADIPDMVMSDTQMIQVDGTQAVAFTSTDASFGRSAEVWLVRGGKLYQISLPTTTSTAQAGLPTAQAGTPDNSRALLYNLLTTWRWGN